MHVYRYSINASVPMNYNFIEFYTISRFYVTLYLLSYCIFHFSWCRIYMYRHVYIYMYIYVYIYVHMYMYVYACECMLLCIHDYMYVFYVCSFYVCWFYDVFFYLWLLCQGWPNKEVQTNKQTNYLDIIHRCRSHWYIRHTSLAFDSYPKEYVYVIDKVYITPKINIIHRWV